ENPELDWVGKARKIPLRRCLRKKECGVEKMQGSPWGWPPWAALLGVASLGAGVLVSLWAWPG
ncbi:unnamed protein product, partial [Ilex paraguariensis]